MKEDVSPKRKIGTTADDEEQLSRLTRAIEISDSYFLFLVSCNQVPREKELIAQLRKKLPRQKIQIVKFDKPIDNFLNELQKKLEKKKFDAVFVTGLRQSIPSSVEAKENAFIANLNVTRDAFTNLLSCPLVLWLPEYAIGKLMNGAPDFFSIRSGIFFFESDEKLISRQISEGLAGNPSQDNTLRFEDRGKRIYDLEELLSEYRSLPEKKRDLRTENKIKERLANLYYITADYAKAVKLRMDLLNFGVQQDNRQYTAWNLNELALIYSAQGQYDKAIEKFEEALRLYEQSIGKEHTYYATSLSNLGIVYARQGKYEEAIERFEEALRIGERTVGRNHPTYATRLNNLANVYADQGQNEEAIEKFEEALRMGKETIGTEHPDYATRLSNLGNVYADQGRYEEAIAKFEEALRVGEKTIGKDHPDYATRLNNLALVYYSLGKYEEAMAAFEEAVRISEKTIGKDHPDYATSLSNLAEIYVIQGKYTEAIEKFEEAGKIYERVLPQNHPFILDIRNSIQNCRRRLKKQK